LKIGAKAAIPIPAGISHGKEVAGDSLTSGLERRIAGAHDLKEIC
jgi:hypothetical protein